MTESVTVVVPLTALTSTTLAPAFHVTLSQTNRWFAADFEPRDVPLSLSSTLGALE